MRVLRICGRAPHGHTAYAYSKETTDHAHVLRRAVLAGHRLPPHGHVPLVDRHSRPRHRTGKRADRYAGGDYPVGGSRSVRQPLATPAGDPRRGGQRGGRRRAPRPPPSRCPPDHRYRHADERPRDGPSTERCRDGAAGGGAGRCARRRRPGAGGAHRARSERTLRRGAARGSALRPPRSRERERGAGSGSRAGLARRER